MPTVRAAKGVCKLEITVFLSTFTHVLKAYLLYMNRHAYTLKVIRKFFLKHNKSFRWHLGDYEKHNFFPFEGL